VNRSRKTDQTPSRQDAKRKTKRIISNIIDVLAAWRLILPPVFSDARQILDFLNSFIIDQRH
jgi:hypothetical protein